jgi:hypothetical protein
MEDDIRGVHVRDEMGFALVPDFLDVLANKRFVLR